MGDDYDLATFFRSAQYRNEGMYNEFAIEIVFWLIDNQGLLTFR